MPDSNSATDRCTIDPKAVAAREKAPSDLHVIPPTAVAWLAEALRHGALEKGYGVRNWRTGDVRMTTYLDAIGRHLMALQEGEDVAEDSRIPHLAHIAATCAILIDADACGTLVDDRMHGRPDALAAVQAAIRARRLRAT